MAKNLNDYSDNDRSIPWHDSELMRVTVAGVTYPLAYHFHDALGTIIEVPGGERLTTKEAERRGWVIEFPKRMRDFKVVTSTERMRTIRAKQKEAKK